jgi:hypothetical protein
MSTIEVLAVSPGLPVDDLLAHPEGGPQAAAEALSALLPATAFEHADTGTWADPGERADDVVLVSTFGPTTMFLRRPERGLAVPDGMTTFSISCQTVSRAWGVDVAGPVLERLVALSPGAIEYAEGEPLPFEAAFPVDEAAYFDDREYAAAAARWMFGCHPLEPGPLDQVDVGDQPLHAFLLATEPTGAAGPEDDRPGVLQRLFGRT